MRSRCRPIESRMLSLPLRSFPQSRAIWFAERARMPTLLERATYSDLSFIQAKEKPSVGLFRRASVLPFRTLLSDLSSTEDALWERLQRRTREYIKSAAADPVYATECHTTDPDLRFYKVIAAFCASKGLWVPPRKYYRKHVDHGLISCGLVDGKLDVVHVHLLDPAIGRARLLWSARTLGEPSQSDKKSANVNKLLHWEDLRYLRNVLKMRTYDWGGVAPTDEALSGVDRFKQSFGGSLVTEWNVTWRSPGYRRSANVLRRLRSGEVSAR
jgi:hypothetical protein